MARIVLGLADEHDIEVIGVVDGSLVEGERFNGLPALLNGELGEVDWDGVLITGLEDMEAQLRD